MTLYTTHDSKRLRTVDKGLKNGFLTLTTKEELRLLRLIIQLLFDLQVCRSGLFRKRLNLLLVVEHLRIEKLFDQSLVC